VDGGVVRYAVYNSADTMGAAERRGMMVFPKKAHGRIDDKGSIRGAGRKGEYLERKRNRD